MISYFSSRIAALTFALSSGVTSRIPCCFACSAAFFSTSSSVVPLMTCVHPDDGSTLAHSTIFPMIAPPCSARTCSYPTAVKILLNECANEREILRTLEERVNGRLQSFTAMDAIMGCPRRRNGIKLDIFHDVERSPLFVFQGGLLGMHCPVRT